MTLLTKKELADYMALVDKVPESDQAKIFSLLEMDRVERCRESFLFFVTQMWPPFISGKHHQIMAEAFERVAAGKLKRLIINMPPRHAILISMKIPTTNGWKTMADLQVGDYVFGPDGKPVAVLGKSEVFKDRELYRVWTDDGEYLDVDGEHLWTVRLDRKHNIYHDYTTEQLWRRQNGEILRTKRGGGIEFIGKTDKIMRKPRLPDVMPVEYEKKDLPIDPYVFGIWLGDGHSNQAIITAKDDDAVYIRAEIERRGYKTTDQATPMTFGILDLKVRLSELGVLGKKHIPRNYLHASPQQRRDLLKGLMDTDGNISKKGQCFFAQSNFQLIKQVQELLFSLGIKNNYSVTEAKIGDKNYGDTWRISFYAKDVAHLPRKEERTENQKDAYGRYIEIQKLDFLGDTQCIKVDREDGLFLAGDGYICTHNTKSEFASYLLPAWFLGKYPEKKIIQTAHTAELAVGFGRKVRNLVQSEDYGKVFETKLSSDSKAAGRWNTHMGGDYFAIGVGGAVTGKGADLLIIDDPHSEQEAKQGNPAVFDSVYEWYTSGPRQRLQPGGAIIIVMCMTGDTPVLMGNGTQKPLAEIRPGDIVATFDQGRLTTAKVNNWQSSGIDTIYKIQTKSGKILRANERHPFLVLNEGVLEWTRLNQLMVGDELVSLKDVQDPQGQRQSRENAEPAKQKSRTTENTQTLHKNPLEATESGRALFVRKLGVPNLLQAVGYALGITIKNTSQRNLQKPLENTVSNRGMGLLLSNTKQWLQSEITNVMSAVSNLQSKIPAPTGMGNYVSTIAMTPAGYEGYCAMTATSQLDMEKRQMYSNELRRISDFTTDPIVSITLDGEEEVFDVEVDRTENFIANGIVSHNTRWSKRDLTGQILKNAEKDGVNEWEVIDFPAILPSGTPLWPGFWKKEELEALKAELPVAKWEAQYQQNPTSEEGAIVKREHWQIWEKADPPPCDYVIQSWDTAFEKNNRADFSACTTWGIFQHPNKNGDLRPNIILLDAFKQRLEFPELKKKAFEMWQEWNPDTLLVEKRAAGAPLIYEMRKVGIPLSEYTPGKGSDKIARVNAISDLFASGVVWCPETRWADEVMEEMASFPNGDHDDLVDSSSQALLRFRQGGFISVHSDEEDEPRYFRRRMAYY